jgi:hypothetical protein
MRRSIWKEIFGRARELPDGRVIRIDSVTGAQTLLAVGQKLVDPLGVSVAP